jgi:hypothetical protein
MERQPLFECPPGDHRIIDVAQTCCDDQVLRGLIPVEVVRPTQRETFEVVRAIHEYTLRDHDPQGDPVELLRRKCSQLLIDVLTAAIAEIDRRG